MLYFTVILKTILSWPVAAFAIAFLFKKTLPNALYNLFSRRVTLEGFGLKAEVDAQEQQRSGGENPVERKLPTSQAIAPSNRKVINDMEAAIKIDLTNTDADKKEAVLIRALAETRLTAGHEFTYNRIFGSQIVFLRQLNSMSHVTIDQARSFLEPYIVQNPLIYNNFGFEQWIAFLRNSGLIIKEDKFLRIGDIGRDFLFYLTEMQLFEGKVG